MMNQESAVPIFWSAPYQKEIIATITNIKDSKVQFNQVFFYPGGGGQLHDKGSISYLETEIPIIEVYSDEEGVWHKIKKENQIKLEIGKEVLLKLDWERRYNFMKAHSSQHLLTHVLRNRFECDTLKANFEEGKVEIEIDKKLSVNEVLDAFKEANIIINQGEEVVSIIVDQETYSKKYKSEARGKKSDEEPVRLIQLGKDKGFDLVCCGGIHVKNLTEINGIVLDNARGNFIKYYVDKYAVEFANEQRGLMISLEDATEKKGNKLLEMVANKIESNEMLTRGNVRLLKLIFENIKTWSEEISGKSIILLELEEIDRQIIQSSAKELAKDSFLGLIGSDNTLYLLSSIDSLPANEIVNKINSRTGAKGGGSKTFAQISIKDIKNPFSILREIIKEF